MTERKDWMDDSDYEWSVKFEATKKACRAAGTHNPVDAICMTDGVYEIWGFKCKACGYYGSS